jgi:protein involved in polysaccharide export with SLBB domain
MVSNPIQINDGKGQLIALLTDQIKSSKPSGRVIAEFDLDILSAKPDLDTYLEDGDEIFVPAKTQQVYIFGDVAQEGAVRYMPNANIDKYLSMAGNMLETADKKQIFIVYPNGETYRYNSSSSILSIVQVADNNELIYPGSIIYVPKKADIGSNLLVAQIWAPIISGLALSLASLNALNN